MGGGDIRPPLPLGVVPGALPLRVLNELPASITELGPVSLKRAVN